MKYYLEEKIGEPELFTGRKKELAFFLKWIGGTKRKLSKSAAILSRRKTGKSVLMQRLYNICWVSTPVSIKTPPCWFRGVGWGG